MPAAAVQSVFASARRHYQSLFDDELERSVMPKLRLESVSRKMVNANTTTSVGLHRLHLAEQMLETAFSMKRFHFDRQFHNNIIRAMAPVLVGDEWSTLGPKIMRDRNWPYILKLVAAMGPRRMGKSVAVAKAMVVLGTVMLLNGGVENGKAYTQTVFSTGKRASTGIRQHVMTFYAEIGVDHLIVRDSAEQVILSTIPGEPMAPRLIVNFLPAGSTTYV